VKEPAARLILGLLSVGLVVVALGSDLPRLSGGRFWGDGATYYTAAWSLVEDHDLRYEARDAFRVRREFQAGAQGIFLKRSSGGLTWDSSAGFPWISRVPEGSPRIYFAKPFLYPVVAAPLVSLMGTKGLLVTNALALSVALVFAYVEVRRRAAPAAALASASALILLTVAPVYLLWPSPEAMGLGLAAAALWAWRARRPLLSAVLIGIAAYSKPPNIFLALPLGLEPFLETGLPVLRRLLESARRGALVAASALALFGLTMAVTGEWNYQGGHERKTFYGTLPFEDHRVTFGNSGVWMSTNQVGPSVEGDKPTSQGQEPPRTRSELRLSLLWNLGYFWFGRFGGIVPYFLPFAAATVLFLATGPREREGWWALLVLAVSWAYFIVELPDNWYGGSGTLGNRYFLNLLPLGAFLIPRRRAWLVAFSGALGALLFTGALIAHPMRESLSPGDHAMHGAFRWMPPELTMLNDLSVFGEPWRKKRPVGRTDSEAKRWDPAAYYLYFPDDGTWGREERGSRVGFWLRGGAPAEVFLRALAPVRSMKVRIEGGPVGDEVVATVGGRSGRVSVPAGGEEDLRFAPPGGFPYKGTFVHVLRFRSARGAPPTDNPDSRPLGSFVSIVLEPETTASTQR